MTQKISVSDAMNAIHAMQISMREDFRFINHGGCGFFALELAKRLRALGFDARIKVFGYDYDACYDDSQPHWSRDHEAFVRCVYDDEGDCEVVFLDDYRNIDVSEVEQTLSENGQTDDIENWNMNGVNFSHIVVELDGRYIDGHHVFHDEIWFGIPTYEGEMSLEALSDIVQDEWGWNDTWDVFLNSAVVETMDQHLGILPN